MPFDISTTNDVASLRADIRALSTRPDVISRLSAFSGWKIAAAEQGSGYRLIQCNADNTAPLPGNYVTNLVLQGGGTLGLAHAGLIVGLEDAGFRFPAIAGTSAGAIVTLGQFALRGPSILTPVGEKLTGLVDEMPMDTFVDGPRAVRRIVKRYAARRTLARLVLLPGLFMTLRHLLRFRGLNSGLVFENWMSSLLREACVFSVSDLIARMGKIATDLTDITDIRLSNGRQVPSKQLADYNPFIGKLGVVPPDVVLKLITTAMPTGMKFCLPQQLHLLAEEYNDVTPAKLVRMSMSIPLFFEPCVLRTRNKAWADHIFTEVAPFVSDRAAHEMAELEELIFLDGGLFSNLPTDEAVKGMSRDVASISVPLVHDNPNVRIRNRTSIGAFAKDAGAVANAVRLQRDRDAHSGLIREAADNRKIMKIDTGRANWLNFTMSGAEKEDLYLAGLKRVRTFLSEGK